MRFLVFLAFLLLPPVAQAQLAVTVPAAPTERVVAVVNDEPITRYDFVSRMGLAFFSSNMEPTDENQRKMGPQVLRSLIDERLQAQEAKETGVSISDDEVNAALTRLAQDNGVSFDQLPDFLKSQGVSYHSLRDQVKTALMWQRVVVRQLRPLVEVGEEEVTARLERLKANVGKPEYLLAEIVLAVDDEGKDAEVKDFATRLVDQLRGGASFPSAAQQFSASAAGRAGGDLGWVLPGQLAADLDAVLANMESGQITDPIKSGGAWHILVLREKRLVSLPGGETTVSLQQAFLPKATPDTPVEDLAKAVEALRATGVDCKALEAKAKEQNATWQVKDLGAKPLDQLPGWVQQAVSSLKEGELSEPFSPAAGVLLIQMCKRDVKDGDFTKIRQDLTASIGTEKLELQARRLLRDLRRNALVDVRL